MMHDVHARDVHAREQLLRSARETGTIRPVAVLRTLRCAFAPL